MRCGVVMKKTEYDDNSIAQVTIRAIEVCDQAVCPTAGANSSRTFTVAHNNTTYIVRYVDITENAYKSTILNNYDHCYYDKATNKVIPEYNTPTDRALSTLSGKYPYGLPCNIAELA